ncbi:MAG: formylglycine-generating enzyme family protein [Treponema sp.]|jgi:hypothetical protein|nr:formylglycine-generating enzyme family protein [Treponema sp.]
MALNKDTLFNAVLAATGGKVYVKYNVNGDPLYMVRIPKFNIEHIDASLGSGVHPAFVVDGVIKNEIFIGACQAIFEKGCAISIPGQSPKTSVNFDQAKTACVANGPGFHLMTNWEWAAIALWCVKNGFQPRGNTSSGKSHEAAYETGTPAPENAAKILGGSGPVSWRHDNSVGGVADLVGNVWEWNDGLKSVDGRLYFPSDNNFTQPETQWPASSIYLDASAGPGDRSGEANSGTPILSNAITKHSETPTPAGGADAGYFDYTYNGAWKSATVSAGFDSLPLAVRQQAAQLLITPKLTAGGTPLFDNIKGGLWVRNYGERFPRRGGDWGCGAYAGLASLSLYYARSTVYTNGGCRPAFIL